MLKYLWFLNDPGDGLLLLLFEIWSDFQQDGQRLLLPLLYVPRVPRRDHGRYEALQLGRALKVAEPGGVRTGNGINKSCF